jgi:hypothetical protein
MYVGLFSTYIFTLSLIGHLWWSSVRATPRTHTRLEARDHRCIRRSLVGRKGQDHVQVHFKLEGERWRPSTQRDFIMVAKVTTDSYMENYDWCFWVYYWDLWQVHLQEVGLKQITLDHVNDMGLQGEPRVLAHGHGPRLMCESGPKLDECLFVIVFD